VTGSACISRPGSAPSIDGTSHAVAILVTRALSPPVSAGSGS